MVSLQKLAAEAVQPAYEELVRQPPQQAVLYIDESPTNEGVRAKSGAKRLASRSLGFPRSAGERTTGMLAPNSHRHLRSRTMS